MERSAQLILRDQTIFLYLLRRYAPRISKPKPIPPIMMGPGSPDTETFIAEAPNRKKMPIIMNCHAFQLLPAGPLFAPHPRQTIASGTILVPQNGHVSVLALSGSAFWPPKDVATSCPHPPQNFASIATPSPHFPHCMSLLPMSLCSSIIRIRTSYSYCIFHVIGCFVILKKLLIPAHRQIHQVAPATGKMKIISTHPFRRVPG